MTAVADRIWKAEPPQAAMLRQDDVDELLYGGSRGGGKSDALLIFNIRRRTKYPGSSGLILRRKLTDLTKQGALIPRSHELLGGIAAWSGDTHKWRFANGSVLEFGHAKDEADVMNYVGAAYEDICADQLEQFTEWQWAILRGSLRTTRLDCRPVLRATANPGGVGHVWVKSRYIDVASAGELYMDPETGLTRMFIPAKATDNPHLNAAYHQMLASLPEPWRSAWRDGRWDVFIGQFFSDWHPRLHLCTPFEIPRHWRRIGMEDWGYARPFCYLQAAISPDGMLYFYRELYQSLVKDADQAAMIAELCRPDPPEYIVAGPDLWHKREAHGGHGESVAETYEQVWKHLDPSFRTRLLMADTDRITGWQRVREHLKPYVGPDGRSSTAMLQIFKGTCPNLVRTLPGLIFDEHKQEDLDTDGEDHAADALRFGVMSRPHPARPKPKQDDPFDAATLWKEHRKRQRRRRWIGGEIN